jgi:uncharacterized membrane protein
MPYHFQQTPKILDTGIIKMQASVATALLLLFFFFPRLSKLQTPCKFQNTPPFLFLLLLLLFLSVLVNSSNK